MSIFSQGRGVLNLLACRVQEEAGKLQKVTEQLNDPMIQWPIGEKVREGAPSLCLGEEGRTQKREPEDPWGAPFLRLGEEGRAFMGEIKFVQH